MNTHSRRTVLKAAAAGTAAIGLMAAGRAVGTGSVSAGSTEGMTGPVVAYVSDAKNGEIVVMVGTSEIVRHDADLVARLMTIAREATDVVTS